MCTFIFLEKICGWEMLWIVGDNFAATTYRKHFLNKSEVYVEHGEVEDYIKNNFEFKMYCNSRFNSPTGNMFVRIQNTFAGAVNKNVSLPKYNLIVLDDDLITYMDFKGAGVTKLLGKWIKWLIKEFDIIIQTRKEQLPIKAKESTEPCTYWCLAPTHHNFNQQRNDLRKKLNFCLESLLKGWQDMRVIKLKKWDFNDVQLVSNDKITLKGLFVYWESIDQTLKYNISHHELYLAKSVVNAGAAQSEIRNGPNPHATGSGALASASQNGNRRNETSREDVSSGRRPEEIVEFFDRHRRFDQDRFHWRRTQNTGQPHSGNRFILPRPRRF